MVYRNKFNNIKPWLGEEKILIIKGARQTGKTTLLQYIKEYLEKKNKTVVYFSVDGDLDNLMYSDARLFIKFIHDQYFPVKEKIYILLDEFQYINNAGLFLKNIFDQEKKNIQLIVSGSSSLEITKNSEYLTGRKIDFFLTTLSFREFLAAKSDKKYNFSWSWQNKLSDLLDFHQVYQKDLLNNLLEYVNWGGYPEVTTTSNTEKRKAILNDIVKTYIKKDVADFLHVGNITGFNNLVAVLAGQVGSLVNVNELSNTLGLNIRTANKYLDILQGTFIFSRIPPFFSNIRKTITKTPKIYCHDFGIIKSVLNLGAAASLDLIKGEIIENFVFSELSQNFKTEEIFFYRTLAGAEIDFMVKGTGQIIPIEVKFRKNFSQTPAAIKRFGRDYEKEVKIKLVITRDYLGYEEKSDCYFIPVELIPFLELS